MNAAKIRSDWVGQVVDGRFPLLQWLGGAGPAGVFLTEMQGTNSQKAAIKLVAANRAEADRRSTLWTEAASLAHPHLIKVFRSGRCQFEGIDLVYIVTEYADEVLSQIIPQRPLTADEAREMLDPVTDTLSYLHAKGFVHGSVTPSNILVAGERLKLSVDNLLPSGSIRDRALDNVYDAPLNRTSTVTPAADIWGLGVTIVEVLTQHPPERNHAEAAVVVPAGLPDPFSEIARRCLQADPGRRCTLAEIKALLGSDITAHHEPVDLNPIPAETRKHDESSSAGVPLIPIIISLVALLAIVAVLVLRSHKTQPAPPTESQNQAPAESSAPPPSQPAAGAAARATEKGSVSNRVLPSVSDKALESIHGTVHVAVRVQVDDSGAVSDALLASPGPSKYFARLALESAHAWKFTPARTSGHPAPSVWLLRYRFKNSGVDVIPTEETP
jgi:TonB family protein